MNVAEQTAHVRALEAAAQVAAQERIKTRTIRKAAELARETNYELLREKRRERKIRRLMIAIALLVPCAILYGLWYFAIEPIIHYHSLSVACSTHVISACSALTQY